MEFLNENMVIEMKSSMIRLYTAGNKSMEWWTTLRNSPKIQQKEKTCKTEGKSYGRQGGNSCLLTAN